MAKRLLILGSTGSIGKSTLKVLAYQKETNEFAYDYEVSGLFANSNIETLVDQVQTFSPSFCGLFDESKKDEFNLALKAKLNSTQYNRLTIVCGKKAINQLVASANFDVVMGAIVGFAGLETSLIALESDKTLLLANKESLVVGGHLIKETLQKHPKAKLIPVDSEHNAIYQSLPLTCQQNICAMNLKESGVEKLLLTASGGPFLNFPLDEFVKISPAQALKHPNWSMGAKITIDSSTLMNKGLELIEACVLFNCTPEQIQTVIHPQSIVHSGVQYIDKSLIVQMGPTDMCVPIAYALNYPSRSVSSCKTLDLFSLSGLTFAAVDNKRFPNFVLTQECYKLGFTYTCALNAANEITVAAFLENIISYPDIYKYNKETVYAIKNLGLDPEYYSYAKILEIDHLARDICRKLIAKDLKD